MKVLVLKCREMRSGIFILSRQHEKIKLNGSVYNFSSKQFPVSSVHWQAAQSKMVKDTMKIEARYVKRKQLSEYLPAYMLKKEKKVCRINDLISFQLVRYIDKHLVKEYKTRRLQYLKKNIFQMTISPVTASTV